MAKNGSREWYKEKYDSAKAEVATLKAELKAAQGSALPEDTVFVDTSRLDDRRKVAVEKFLRRTQGYVNVSPSQVVAACLVYLSEGTRRINPQGLMGQIKRMKGTGLR
jgi:hypothetical protein